MTLREAFQKMIQAFPGGWESMAAALGMNVTKLENRVYERNGQEMGVRTARLMQEFSRTTFFVEALCAQSGGTFLKLPNFDHLDESAADAKIRQLVVQLGKLTAEFNKATEDRKISKSEHRKIDAIVDDLHKTIDEFKAITYRVHPDQFLGGNDD